MLTALASSEDRSKGASLLEIASEKGIGSFWSLIAFLCHHQKSPKITTTKMIETIAQGLRSDVFGVCMEGY